MKALSIAFFSLLLISCSEQPIPPEATLEIFPSIGDSTTLVELNANNSIDGKFNYLALVYRWDFDGDLAWDTEFSADPIMVRHFPMPGTYHINVEVMNPDGLRAIAGDSVIIFGRNPDVSILTDPRDNQLYPIVKIRDRWWMAESLRYGVEIDPWTQGMKNNQLPERVVVQDSSRSGSFSIYSWYEALNYEPDNNQGICPDGWHIPSKM
jgi:hypothetical protein